MNEKNYKALLKSLGISETVITELDKDDFDVKAAVAAYNESQKAHYTDIIKNEIAPGIEAEITGKVEGKIYGTLINDIKKNLGVPIEKIKDKPAHEALKIAKAFLDETYSKNPNAEQIKELQEKAMEWQNKYTDFETKFTSEVEKVRNEEKQKTVTKLADIELQKKFNSVPAEKILGKKHSDGIYFGVKSYLGSKYDFALDEKENPVPLEKGTSKRATGKDAAGKEYFLNVDDLVLTSLKELNFLVESNGGEGSGNSGKNGNGNGGTQEKSAHLKALEERAMKAVA